MIIKTDSSGSFGNLLSIIFTREITVCIKDLYDRIDNRTKKAFYALFVTNLVVYGSRHTHFLFSYDDREQTLAHSTQLISLQGRLLSDFIHFRMMEG